jgi:hypothetical protein
MRSWSTAELLAVIFTGMFRVRPVHQIGEGSDVVRRGPFTLERLLPKWRFAALRARDAAYLFGSPGHHEHVAGAQRRTNPATPSEAGSFPIRNNRLREFYPAPVEFFIWRTHVLPD